MALLGTPVLIEAESPEEAGPTTQGVPVRGQGPGPPSCRLAFPEELRGRDGAEGARALQGCFPPACSGN